MNLNMFSEVTDGRMFPEFQDARINDMRRDVEALEQTAAMMRTVLLIVQDKTCGMCGIQWAGRN